MNNISLYSNFVENYNQFAIILLYLQTILDVMSKVQA